MTLTSPATLRSLQDIQFRNLQITTQRLQILIRRTVQWQRETRAAANYQLLKNTLVTTYDGGEGASRPPLLIGSLMGKQHSKEQRIIL